MNYEYTLDCPHYLTGVIHKHLREGLEKNLKNEGFYLSHQQIHLLLYLFEEDGISQKRLSELTRMNKISIVKALNLLEANNLAFRVQNDVDQRNKNIFLTAEGKKLKVPVRRIINQHRAAVFSGITEEEADIYKTVLRKMLKNMTT
ncbi:MarR family winged helix-turn-helix transcriptional regulator [Reinekea marinisedimentorum]|uniref:DNA-binding MarR family transcriptional regulator n=1 Tax=Reinekea marinisedimentorum TaxID=230495 RepID=A0A4R3IC32_9GAMM|nr:MarR family transcriptional regulator [Reinekea marinisedimentorum]TCS43705.1 DNA-binding MarR family transcriptional regulator [Reinekea marinisedimentorum]